MKEKIKRLMAYGEPLDVTDAEREDAIRLLQEEAGKRIDWGDHIRAQLCLMEAKRLAATELRESK